VSGSAFLFTAFSGSAPTYEVDNDGDNEEDKEDMNQPTREVEEQTASPEK
jgi:hypothetical protein